MIKVGITGNIGSGKSTVARLFRMLSVPVFYADIEARFITDEYDVLAEIRKAFGDKIIDRFGLLKRKELATIVFSDAEKLSVLNAIIHPRVREAFNDWCTLHDSDPYVLHESAILFESGMADLCDKVIVVTAPVEIRINRVVQRDGFTREEVVKRMASQWDEKKLVTLSDFEIVNDDVSSLIEQVNTVNSILKSKNI